MSPIIPSPKENCLSHALANISPLSRHAQTFLLSNGVILWVLVFDLFFFFGYAHYTTVT